MLTKKKHGDAAPKLSLEPTDKDGGTVSSLKRGVRISFAGVASAGLVSAGLFHWKQNKHLDEINNLKAVRDEYLSEQMGIAVAKKDKEIERLTRLRDKCVFTEGFCWGLIVGSIAGFSLTFIF